MIEISIIFTAIATLLIVAEHTLDCNRKYGENPKTYFKG